KTSVAPEQLVESRQISKADLLRHLSDRYAPIGKKILCVLQPNGEKILAQRYADGFAEAVGQPTPAHSSLAPELHERKTIAVAVLDNFDGFSHREGRESARVSGSCDRRCGERQYTRRLGFRPPPRSGAWRRRC